MQNINWAAKETQAKQKTIAELKYAIDDCIGCVKAMGTSPMFGKDASYYMDEASIYRQELIKREAK